MAAIKREALRENQAAQVQRPDDHVVRVYKRGVFTKDTTVGEMYVL
jgi:hypothetical protein